ncbi:MAG TPA: hypothetical protein VMT34_03680, partial [Aggregatilineales bacterium]|nr:hypothetical protein [Aggregatilineales bacterium]
MSDSVIQVRGLGKKYRIQASSGKHGNYRRLTETLTDAFTSLVKRSKGGATPSRQDFWALRDVSFDVKQG